MENKGDVRYDRVDASGFDVKIENRELKHRRFWPTDGNWKLNFSLFGAFSRHHGCNVKPQWSAWAFPVRGKEQNHAKKGNIQLPVAVRGLRTSVLKLPNRRVHALDLMIASWVISATWREIQAKYTVHDSTL